ncbi:MAG: 3'-5' exonuclease [Anaerocolumna aminovalerica]|uniref:HelD family protein n=1 Tax=Anaerocolumna aminovalerica TaxID=1527 RepID=UPI00290FA871|nr:3'-5' exonuclease [Anaerocolumna aminovalerica]MDU6263522.1 3'-5' exonuclease [Anaerocolumna aminovalerica]
MEERMDNNCFEEKHEELRSEWKKEEDHLEQCVAVIQNNINDYREKLKMIRDETKELYDNYRSNNPELHNDLVIGLSMQSDMERALNKNLSAIEKPYFGRIDYVEHEENEIQDSDKKNPDDKIYSLYIGKNGISKSSTDIVIVDWRAPVSSVYYDSETGESSYLSPYGDPIFISLNLKRTFEIGDSKLIDYYDTDVIANDEFLTKYLSKNKEVVLGEIIATIQKEQNEIIRDTPWHNVIVQGVAGSGKTTVAMHRISYILYNYKEKFRSDEFYIIGSNKMLLNYITGVLPNLDVYNINQMTMVEFLNILLNKDFDIKKNKYVLKDNFSKQSQIKKTGNEIALNKFKGSLSFVKALETYINDYEIKSLKPDSIVYHNKEVYSQSEILGFLDIFKDKPLQEKIDLLNKRLSSKIRLVNEKEQQEKETISSELKKFKDYFGKKSMKINLIEIYKNFLQDLILNQQNYINLNYDIPEEQVIRLLIDNFDNKIIDLYDLAMLAYIKKRLKLTIDFEQVSHIIVDEAQDFGVSVFYVMKQLFHDCTYTIMGDITQNIYYDTGMNDWESLKEEVFYPDKDKFYVLAKSYRNTVEISNFASKVLKQCTFKTYDIEPVIRHGKEVSITKSANQQEMVSKVMDIISTNHKDGYTTIAIICRTMEETRMVHENLKKYIEVEALTENMEDMNFTNGIMVLPIHMTKGLEFDSVILWNPDCNSYEATDADAKLLYVAITRALHELHIVYKGELAKLLS